MRLEPRGTQVNTEKARLASGGGGGGHLRVRLRSPAVPNAFVLRRAFTLVELLVVIGIIGVLISILLPTLSRAREAANATQCASNLRQLAIAATMYAGENGGFYPPANLYFVSRNLSRWHGTRPDLNTAFDFAGSPMLRQLQAKAIKACPSFFPTDTLPPKAFEHSAGGYGYNSGWIGSSSGIPALAGLSLPPVQYDERVSNVPAKLGQVRRPERKYMFADAAIANPGLIEYSFLEPPLDGFGNVNNSPSFHFRHRGKAEVAFVDAHVEPLPPLLVPARNVYKAVNARLNLGYPSVDNAPFARD